MPPAYRGSRTPSIHLEIAKHLAHVLPGEALARSPEARQRHPFGAGGVVGGARSPSLPLGDEVEIHRRKPAEALEVVAIPIEPERFRMPHAQPGLLAQLAAGGAFEALARFDESARNV